MSLNYDSNSFEEIRKIIMNYICSSLSILEKVIASKYSIFNFIFLKDKNLSHDIYNHSTILEIVAEINFLSVFMNKKVMYLSFFNANQFKVVMSGCKSLNEMGQHFFIAKISFVPFNHRDLKIISIFKLFLKFYIF